MRTQHVQLSPSARQGTLPGRAGALAVLALWLTRIGLLRLRRETLRSVQGRAVLLLLLLALPSLGGIALAPAPAWAMEAASELRAGALAAAHLAALLAYLGLVSALLLPTAPGTDEAGEPLLSVPWALAEGRFLTVLADLAAWAVYLAAFLLLFHRSWAAPGAGQAALHAGTTVATLVASGALLAALGVPALIRWVPGPLLPAVRRGSGLLFVAAFPLVAILPGALGEHLPNWAGGLGGMVAGVPAGWPSPAAATLAAGSGEIARATGHLATSIGLALAATGLLWRVRTTLVRGHRSPAMQGKPDRVAFRRKPLPNTPGWLADTLVLVHKDRVREGVRARRTQVGRATASLAWTGAIALVGGPLLSHSLPDDVPALGLTGTLPVLLAAWVVLPRSLPSHGADASALRPLGHILDPARLLRARILAAALRSAPLACLHALVATGALRLAGVPAPSPAAAALVGASAAALLAPAGVATGMLLPDPERRSPFLPGASVGGQAVFLVLAGLVITGHIASLGVLPGGTASPRGHLLPGLVANTVVAGATLLLSHGALRRLHHEWR